MGRNENLEQRITVENSNDDYLEVLEIIMLFKYIQDEILEIQLFSYVEFVDNRIIMKVLVVGDYLNLKLLFLLSAF